MMDKLQMLAMVMVVGGGVAGCENQVPLLVGDEGDQDPESSSGATEDGVEDPSTTEEGDLSTFVQPKDGGVDDCDPWAQDCPEGEKCVAYSSDGGNWNANKCVTINGDGQPGDVCTWDGITVGTDSCGAGSNCWDVMDVDGQLQGTCTAFCSGSVDNPSCAPESACLIANEGSINLCIATCDPIAQDCGSGLGCFWGGDDFQCIFTAGEIMGGEACGFLNDCAPGHLCAGADVLPACAGTACCTPYCDLATPECGDPQTQCTAFFDEGTAPPDTSPSACASSPARSRLLSALARHVELEAEFGDGLMFGRLGAPDQRSVVGAGPDVVEIDESTHLRAWIEDTPRQREPPELTVVRGHGLVAVAPTGVVGERAVAEASALAPGGTAWNAPPASNRT